MRFYQDECAKETKGRREGEELLVFLFYIDTSVLHDIIRFEQPYPGLLQKKIENDEKSITLSDK